MLTRNAGWWFSWLISARWIGFRLDFMVSLLLTAAPLLIVAVHDRVSPRLAGLALTQSLYLAGLLQWWGWQACAFLFHPLCYSLLAVVFSDDAGFRYSRVDQ
jgi:hypothetical protein